MKYSKDNYINGFKNPSNEYRWHQIIHRAPAVFEDAPEEFEQLIRDVADLGRGGIVANIRYCPEYLDREGTFENLNKMVDRLYEKGLNFWIYDELGYPSGSAGGRTVLDHPEYAVKGIVYFKTEGNGYGPVTIQREDDVKGFRHAYAITEEGRVEASVTNDTVTFEGADGDWTLYVFCEKFFYEGTHVQMSGYASKDWLQPYYPNLMDKEAVRRFIDLTYKAYAEKYKHFDKLPGIFTDEPSLMEPYQHTGDKIFKYAQASWVDCFEDEFEKMHGYKIEENLHHIFEGDSDLSKTVRINYRQTVAKLLSENYFGQINDFCVEHGSKLSGHCLLEEVLHHQVYYYGDLMACLRKMGVPGVDSLNGMTKMFRNPGWPSFLAVKYATSTNTLQREDRLSMVELCAVDVKQFPITEEERDNIFTTANTMLFNGITHINAYFPLEQAREKANFFSDYLSRLCYLSRSLKWDGDVGLYYPINSYQAYSVPSNKAHRNAPEGVCISECALELYKNSLDYTVVDNIFLKEARVENGTLTNGFATFKAICMPGCEAVPYDVMEKLLEFERDGGTLIFVGRIPTLCDVYEKTEDFRAMLGGRRAYSIEEGARIIADSCKYPLTVEGGNEDVWLGKYILDGAQTFWILNQNAEDIAVTVSHESTSGFDLYDPTTGEMTELNNNSNVIIAPRSAVLVVCK